MQLTIFAVMFVVIEMRVLPAPRCAALIIMLIDVK